MAGSELLACRSLCYYAGSHPFILRTKYVSASTIEEVDRALAKSRHAGMAASHSASDLAA
jgi:hypothetical protein